MTKKKEKGVAYRVAGIIRYYKRILFTPGMLCPLLRALDGLVGRNMTFLLY
jgi:hypothetical protein